MTGPEGQNLRRGWTTGACAMAATKAAYQALLSGAFPDPVSIILPRGETPSFPLERQEITEDYALAGIIKDAGDDPDVTHGALIIVRVSRGTAGTGVAFKAGIGVGTVTLPGLPVAVGEPAINPRPREMMEAVVHEIAERAGVPGDVIIEISIPGGEGLAHKTWNPRLGITGGLSILGTTGIVHPFSCSAWIHAIHRGIDVARAAGITHVAGATGSTSEALVKAHHALPNLALIDMGDFAGGMLKYIRRHPVSRVTIAGGFGKMTKLAQGHLDLHSARSQVDFTWLAERVGELGGTPALTERVGQANTAAEVYSLARNSDLDLGTLIAKKARQTAEHVFRDAPIDVDTLVIDRKGSLIGQA